MSALNCSVAMNRISAEQMIAAESELVEEARAGSPNAFAELYSLHSRRLYKTIFAITKHPEDTEDALQDTFMRACLAIHAFEGRSTVYSWLTRIAINSALLVLRKRRSRSEMCFEPQQDDHAETTSLEVKDSAPNPEQVFDLGQRRMILARAVGTLDTRLRGPIEMHLEHDSSLKEISQRFRISEGAVKARLFRARVQLLATVKGVSHARGRRKQSSTAAPDVHAQRLCLRGRN